MLGILTLPADERAHGPEESAAALQVRDGYQLRLIASEPLVADPITARIDARGRLWVVEMPDYPTGPRDGQPPSGRIKILEDQDRDGVFDHATVFADGLLFATGVQPYRDGAIVTLAGQIVFMQDRDNDGVAEHTEVWFKGFAEQNQQLRANHPTLGPDGMVYVAGGLRGGSVEALHDRFQRREQPVDLRDRDFCFDPDGGWWGAVAGKSQFGMTIDDYGRRIGCSNRNPAMMTPILLAAVDRDPLLAARDAIHDVALAAERSRVVARADAWTTSNLHSGQFSAACGVLAAGMVDDKGEWLLACEPTAYLVQRQRVQRAGSVWESRREADEAEFLSSSDTWFRPVDATLGPGRSVLVVDMARAVIEHPDFMPTELKTRPDQWEGSNLGRIWQISPLDSDSSTSELTARLDAYAMLSSESSVQRQLASQSLLESEDADAERLRSIVQASNGRPRGRARAAWIMKRHGWFTLKEAAVLSKSPHPRLRALAIELSGDIEGGWRQSVQLANDADPLVLRAAAGVLAGTTGNDQQRVEAMLTIAATTDDAWTLRQLGAVDDSALEELATAVATSKTSRPTLTTHLIQRLAIDSPESAAGVVVQRIGDSPLTIPLQGDVVDCLEAWITGTRRGRRSPSQVIDNLAADEKERLLQAFGAARDTAVHGPSPPSLRARTLAVANETGFLPKDLRSLLDEDSPPEVRVAALPIALRHDSDWTRGFLSQRMMGMSIPLRAAAVTACMRSVSDTQWLLERIAEGAVPKTVIDPATAKRLRQHSKPEIRELATQWLSSDPNRTKVLARYAEAAQTLGDPLVGKKLFLEHCSACHHIDGQGTNVGPDISDTRTKTADALLTSILDPNAAIDASFVQYSVLTFDGRILDGLLIDETAESITLQQKGGERVTIPRDEIEALQAPGVSLMPEGFEQSMDVEAMSHLLAYLKNWRYLTTTIPGVSP